MDIYFIPEYGVLNEIIEHGEATTFSFRCEFGEIQHLFIKRKVPYMIGERQYYDAVTPYGYGGPNILWTNDREKLICEYTQAYVKYCHDEGIVDEFVRFHPLYGNALGFDKLYEVILSRHTAAIDVSDPDFYMVQFTSECRNRIKNARKRGVTVEVDEDLVHLDEFIKLYYMTMDKNRASDYYYFDHSYFEQLLAIPDCKFMLVNAFYEGQIIASVLYMMSDGNMHYHLSANNPEYYKLAANNLIVYESCEYGNRNGFHWLHLGGGLSSAPDDNLFRFKRGFARTENNLKDFYIGKAVFDEGAYQQLCIEAEKDGVKSDGFFPAYRAAH